MEKKSDGRAEYASVHEEVGLSTEGSPSGVTRKSLITQAVLEFEAVLLPWSLDLKCKPPQLAF